MWENSLTPACSLVHRKSNWSNGSNLLYHIQMAQNSLPFQLKRIPFVSRSAFTPKSANRKNLREEFKSLDPGPPEVPGSHMHFLIIHTCTVVGETILPRAVDILLKHWNWKAIIEMAMQECPCHLASTENQCAPNSYFSLYFLVVVLRPFVKGSHRHHRVWVCVNVRLSPKVTASSSHQWHKG